MTIGTYLSNLVWPPKEDVGECNYNPGNSGEPQLCSRAISSSELQISFPYAVCKFLPPASLLKSTILYGTQGEYILCTLYDRL